MLFMNAKLCVPPCLAGMGLPEGVMQMASFSDLFVGQDLVHLVAVWRIIYAVIDAVAVLTRGQSVACGSTLFIPCLLRCGSWCPWQGSGEALPLWRGKAFVPPAPTGTPASVAIVTPQHPPPPTWHPPLLAGEGALGGGVWVTRTVRGQQYCGKAVKLAVARVRR